MTAENFIDPRPTVRPVAALLGPESAAEDLKNALCVLVCFKDNPLPPVDNEAVRRRIESALAKMQAKA